MDLVVTPIKSRGGRMIEIIAFGIIVILFVYWGKGIKDGTL